MSAIPCSLFRISLKYNDVPKTLLGLGLLGLFEPVEPLLSLRPNAHESLKKAIDDDSRRYQKAALLVNSITESKADKVLKIDTNASTKDIESIWKKFHKLDALVEACHEFEMEIEKLRERTEEIEEKLLVIKPIRQVSSQILGHHYLLNSRLTHIPKDALELVKLKLSEYPECHTQTFDDQEDTELVLFMFDPSLTEIVDSVTKSFVTIDLSTMMDNDRVISPKEAYALLEKERVKIEKKIKEIESKMIKRVRPMANLLRLAADVLSTEQQALQSIHFVGHHFGYDAVDMTEAGNLKRTLESGDSLLLPYQEGELLQIDGWLDPEHEPLLRDKLNLINPTISLTTLDHISQTESRTILRNTPALKPFELITTLMGTPGLKETDPSPFVAPFFVAFFGFALGDAGYGILLAVVSYYMLRSNKLLGKAKDAFLLVLYCGISSFVFGVITGSWFGANLSSFGVIGEWLNQFKLLDIQSNLILVLITSLVIGLIHQLFGLILSLVSYVKNGEISKALLNPGSWILLISTFMITFTSSQGYWPQLNSAASTMFLYSVLIFFVLAQGRDASRVWMIPLVGVAQLFNVTSYISNTLSYARLLALAMATGVIASVVNLLAGMTLEVGVIGYLLAPIVLLVGHSFNIVIGVMGTFINVARLHLVEFFPRFYEAKGTALHPITFETRYNHFDEKVNPQAFVFNKTM